MRGSVWHRGHSTLSMDSYGLQYRPRQVAVVRGLPMHITCHYHLTVVPTPRNRHETIRFRSKGARLSPGKITVSGHSKKPRFGFTIDPEHHTRTPIFPLLLISSDESTQLDQGMTKIYNQRRSNKFSEILHEYMRHLCGTILLAIHDLPHIMEDILSRSKLAHLFPRTSWSHGWLN